MWKYLTLEEKDILRKRVCAFLDAGMDGKEICMHLGISKDMLYRLRISKDSRYKRIKISDYDPEWKQYEIVYDIPGFPNGLKFSKGLWRNNDESNNEMIEFLCDKGVRPSAIVHVFSGRLSRATVYRRIKNYKNQI